MTSHTRLPLAVLALGAAAFGDTPTDRWRERSEVDKVNDLKKVYITLVADGEHLKLGNWFNRSWPTLAAGCEGQASFFVVTINEPATVSPQGWVRVTMRFGPNGKPITENWETTAKGAAIRRLANPISATGALALADKFLLRYSSAQGADVTLEFTLFGAKDHLPKIAQACGWDYERTVRPVR